MELRELGFDQWLTIYSNELREKDCSPARISAVDRGSFLINNGKVEVIAELTGKLSYQIERSTELPCVGDWVMAQYYNNNEIAIIHSVFPRKTFLRRKAAGKKIDYQMIAANIDTAFVVQSCHFDFNPQRLERYLIMAADGNVEPIVILTKTDLITPGELDRNVAIIGSITKAKKITLSNITGVGFEDFQQLLLPAKTYCLLGSSGVGKTTIINRLMGQEVYNTKEVSATGEGAHTTTRRQLIFLNQGSMLIDTPGMRELGIISDEDGIDMGFEEFSRLSKDCRYADCRHDKEPGCAIKSAIEKGQISKERYANYIKLKKEAEYNEMSYLEKRRKDKAFGIFIKSVKKQLKR